MSPGRGSPHLDLLQRWLQGSGKDAADALAILEAFPALPPDLLPGLAALANGTLRTNRTVAQALLARHGLAGELVVQGLGDGSADVRAAAVSWLVAIGDRAAIASLRSALAKERRDVPRASMLTALRELGDDLSADLAPGVLLAEALRSL